MKTFTLFLCIVILSLADSYADPGDPGSPSGLVTGTVQTGGDLQPVEYANIALYNKADSSLVTGGITDINGNFKLEKVPFGEYYLVANFIGFSKKTVGGISLNRSHKVVDLGSIGIDLAAENLDEVEVVADRTEIVYKADKKVITVGNDIIAASGTAVDVLEKAPSIEVDVEGNVKLRGSGNFKLLIDGKPTSLDAAQALKQIPASTLKNIELITNPSAKHDPEGDVGIINLVMKKEFKKGWNGVVNMNLGTGEKYSGDFLANYRSEKVNYFVGGNYWTNNYGITTDLHSRSTYTDSVGNQQVLHYLSEGDLTWMNQGYQLRSGFDYYIDDNRTLSASLSAGQRTGDGNKGVTLSHQYHDGRNDDSYTTDITGKNQTQPYTVDANISYQQKFKAEGEKLDANLSLNSFKGAVDANAQQWVRGDLDNRMLANDRDLQKYQAQLFEFKADYEKPLADDQKLEAGLKISGHFSDDDFIFKNYDADRRLWTDVDSLYGKQKYDHQVYAAYGTYQGRFWGIDYKAGLRGEYVSRNIKNVTDNVDRHDNLPDLFPSLHLTRKLPLDQQLQLSYSRRIRRPGAGQLNEFRHYIDNTHAWSGNYELKPAYTNSFELSYQKKLPKGFTAVELYYKKSYNEISQNLTLDPDDPNFRIFKAFNQDEKNSLGLESSLNLTLTKWWSINAGGRMFYNSLLENDETGRIVRENYGWNARFGNTFNLPKDIRIQTFMYYRSANRGIYETQAPQMFSNLAISKDFFKNKATVILKVSDILMTNSFSFTSEQGGAHDVNHVYREAPVFYLTFSYRFNDFKNRGGGGGADVGGGGGFGF